MARIRVKYIKQDVDRHGNLRTYLAMPGRRKVRIRADVSTPEFWVEYREAVEVARAPVAEAVEPEKPGQPAAPGSVAWLCQRWYASADFKRLGPSTQRTRRRILERCCAVRDQKGVSRGAKPYRQLEPSHVRAWRDALAETPEAANGLVKTVRRVFAWACDPTVNLAETNPARDVPKFTSNGEGWHAWTTGEIEQYIAHHPIGSQAYLALALLLFTGVRRSDVVRLGRQMERRDGDGAWLRFTETKGAARLAKQREIPVLPDLQAAIEACPSGHMTYLATAYGKPFTGNGFGNKFRDWCREAGLPHCSPHGLRKAGATIAADAGASAHELMAIFGWQSLQEAERYTRQADRRRLAGRAMRLLKPEGFGGASVALLPTGSDRKDGA